MKRIVLASCLLCLSVPSVAQPPAAAEVETLLVGPEAFLELELPPGAAGLEAAFDGGLLQPVDERLAVPGAGEHWLTVVARDAAGNPSDPRWIRLQVDAEAPSLTVEVQPEPASADGRQWVPLGAQVIATAEDDLTGVRETSVASAERTVTASAPSAKLAVAGRERFAATAWAVDEVGNRAPEQEVEVWVDAVAPTAEIRIDGPAVEVETRTVIAPTTRLEALADDVGSGVARQEMLLDNARVAPAQWHGPWPSGSRKVHLRVEDRVGNRKTTDGLRLEVDATPPRLTWEITSEGFEGEGGERFYREPVTLAVSAEDEVAGVAAVSWAGEGGAFAPLPESLTATGGSVRLRAEDRVGNRVDETATWRTDTEPPALRVVTEEGRQVAPGERLELPEGAILKVSAADDGVGVALQEAAEDGVRWVSLPHDFKFRTWGRYRLVVRAEDQLGNRSEGEWRVLVRRERRR